MILPNETIYQEGPIRIDCSTSIEGHSGGKSEIKMAQRNAKKERQCPLCGYHGKMTAQELKEHDCTFANYAYGIPYRSEDKPDTAE